MWVVVHRDCQTQGCFVYVYFPALTLGFQDLRGWDREEICGGRIIEELAGDRRLMGSNSCSYQAQQEVIASQVQGPMPTTPLHPCP